MNPEVNNILKARLREWAKYRAYVANDTGVGYPAINTIKRIMAPSAGEMADALAPRDWTPEEQVDSAVQILQMLLPEASHAIQAETFGDMQGARLSDRIEWWNGQMRKTKGLHWKDKRATAYRDYKADGLWFLAGRLSLEISGDTTYNYASSCN